MSERFSRQIRLHEVGVEGQRALAEARVVVRGEAASGGVALSYLQRAGVEHACLDVEARDAPPFPHQRHFRFEGARAVAEGAWQALRAVRKVLGVEPPVAQ